MLSKNIRISLMTHSQESYIQEIVQLSITKASVCWTVFFYDHGDKEEPFDYFSPTLASLVKYTGFLYYHCEKFPQRKC